MSAHLNAGSFLQWLSGILCFDWNDVYEELDTQPLRKWLEDIGGLIFHPYINGERSPFMNPGLTGGLQGLRAGHRKIHIILAAMLGTLFAVRLGMECFPQLPVIAAGGSFKYPFWCKMSATVLGRSLSRSERPDASAFGAALIGAGKDSEFYRMKFRRTAGRRFEPSAEAVPIADRQYESFRDSIKI